MARIVLVADDSPTIQKKALAILKGEGFEVETVSNGVAAIKRLAVLHPVVILADVSMPGRDGYEVCEFVKKSADHAHVPVLLVASDMEPYDDARGAEVRADGLVKKPFEPHELVATVVKFAEQSEASAPTMAMPAPSPPPPEPAPEFSMPEPEPEEMPTVVQPVTPDFAASTEGIAFAEPTVEEAPAYAPEPAPAEMEGGYETPQLELETTPEPPPPVEYAQTPSGAEASAAAPESTFEIETSPTPSSYSPPPPPAVETHEPSFLAGLEAAAPEPVFIEEPAAPVEQTHSSGAEIRTMIFRAPLEIAEPVLKDETVPAPPAEPAGVTGLEPQLETPAAEAPPEVAAEQPVEPHPTASVTATSLDSFSLDDAATGQVHFASTAREAEPAETASPAPVEEVSEPVPTEAAPPAPETEPAPPATYAEPASEPTYAEPAPAAIYEEPAPPGPAAAAAPAEAPAEAAAAAPTLDWGMIYTVVHKAVVKMSPPALPTEVVEDLARRIAEEIAAEISSETAQPQG